MSGLTLPGERTDQAALMGAGTVGILALVLGEGPWDQTATIFGLILLLVLFAYYRPPTEGKPFEQVWKALAFSATAGLIGFITLAYPLQVLASNILYQDIKTDDETLFGKLCRDRSLIPPMASQWTG